MADEWLPAQLRVFTDLVSAEAALFKAVWRALKEWAARARQAVFGSHGGAPDPTGLFSTVEWWENQLDDVLVEITEIWDFAARDLGDPEPDALAKVRDHIVEARNRLKGVPDRVYGSMRAETMKATTQGWSMDELAGKIDRILAESGAERWRNRAMVIARTEALSAYNGGKYASFVSVANQLGGDWEKMWLETHDHRTRPTHTERRGVGGTRVGLTEYFKVGDGRGLYPGDAMLPPEESLQCRCSIILLEPGEVPDLSDRHYTSRKAKR